MISVIINCDTRSGFLDKESEFKSMNNGCVSSDFIFDGLVNKRKFFDGFDCEFILYIDEHNPVPQDILNDVRLLTDSVTIRKHSKRYKDQENYSKFNDVNYLAALAQARGDIIVHFDQDTAAFAPGKSFISEILTDLKLKRFISYPSPHSPVAVKDPAFDHMWVSTRFFACKRDILDFTELEKCVYEPEYMWNKYGHKNRKLSWLEHVLGITNESDVYYPKIDTSRGMIFCWNKYIKGTLAKLNKMNYSGVLDYVNKCGGIHYPNDVTAI